MKTWIAGAMQRAILMIVCLVLIIAWGGISAVRMQRDYLPGIANTTVLVSLRASSLQADAVHRTIAPILEDAVRSADGLTNIETNSYDGGLLMSLYFPMNFNMKQAETEIKTAVAAAELPDNVQKPLVSRTTTSSFPILSYSLTGADNKLDEAALRSSVQAEIVRQIRTVPGVADVQAVGAAGSGYVLTIRMNDLQRSGLTVDDVNKAIAAAVPSWPTGKIADNRMSVPVKIDGWSLTTQDVAAIPIRTEMGTVVPLSAVADFSPSLTDVKTVSRTDGKPSLQLNVLKTPSANITDVASRVKERIPQIASVRNGDVRMALTLDREQELNLSLKGLLREGLLGCLFSMLCVLFFFRNVRSTLLIAVSLPVSLLATTGLLHAMGITLNILTVSGLIVAMGRIVDDAIVILDNMYRRAEEQPKAPPLQMLAAAVREMVPAIFASTATTVAVYVPIAMVGGVVSASFSGFAWSVVIALAVSFLTAVFVIPALAFMRWRGAPRQAVTLEPLMRPFLRLALRRRRLVVSLSLALFVAAGILAAGIPANVLPGAKTGEVAVKVELPQGSPLTDVDREVRQVEERLRTDERVASFTASFGSTGVPQADDVFDQGGGFIQPANVANMTVTLKNKAAADPYIAELQKTLSAQTNKAVITVTSQNISGDDSQLKVMLSGADNGTLASASELVRGKLAYISGVSVVGQADMTGGIPKYKVTLDRGKLEQTGVKLDDVNGVISRYMTGAKDFTLPPLPTDGQLVPIPVDAYIDRLSGSSSRSPEALMAALGAEMLTGADGRAVRFDQVAAIAVDSAPSSIEERDGQPFATVTAQITVKDIGGVSRQVDKALQGLELPSSVRYSLGGINEQVTQMIVDMSIAIAFSILLVLLITSTVFCGWKAPLSVLLSVPLALSGVVLALLLFGGEWNLAALIGLLMLTGIVVTNGIVLIDKIERNRRQGMPLEEAVLQGSLSRVRPILMTAGTTVLTLLPLALTHSADTVISQTLGLVVIGGMITSTFNSFAVIPVVYGWLNREGERAKTASN